MINKHKTIKVFGEHANSWAPLTQRKKQMPFSGARRRREGLFDH